MIKRKIRLWITNKLSYHSSMWSMYFFANGDMELDYIDSGSSASTARDTLVYKKREFAMKLHEAWIDFYLELFKVVGV